MKELAEALRAIFEKISDFFDIFDLSFLVSGLAAITPLLVWPPTGTLARSAIHGTSARFFFLLVGAYIAGLAAFAAGRWLRMGPTTRKRYQTFDALARTVLSAHGLQDTSPYAEYLRRTEFRGTWRLYIRLWAEVRLRLHPSPSLSLLNRYWVLAATYDGVAVALYSWVALLVAWQLGAGFESALSPRLGVPAIVALMLLSFACLREAGRYVKYQLEELVATVAAARNLS